LGHQVSSELCCTQTHTHTHSSPATKHNYI